MRRSTAAAWALVAVFAASANLLSGFSCGGGKPQGSPPCCDPTPTPTQAPAIDEVEPNDVPGDATGLGASSQDSVFIGSCSPDDPIDYYASAIPAGGGFLVRVHWDVPNWDLDVLVTGTGYSFSDADGVSPAIVSGVATTSGIAYLQIQCSGAGPGTNYSGSIVEP